MPGGQPELLRVPQAHFGPIKTSDERYVFLSDVLPTAWQAVEYAQVPDGGTVAVFGLGPIGQMSARIALHRGASTVFAIDLVPERMAMAERHGIEVLDWNDHEDISETLRELMGGRGPDSVIDGVDTVRRGGTISLSGVYGGSANPMNFMQMFDKQITIKQGQANVKRWIDDLMPPVSDEADPLGVMDLATHKVPIDEAPQAYEIFQRKQDGAIKIMVQP